MSVLIIRLATVVNGMYVRAECLLSRG